MGRLDTEALIRFRNHAVLGSTAHRLLRYLSSAEVPSSVSIGPGLVIHHHGFGLVIHPQTTIGARVHLFHGVTLGRGDVWDPITESPFGGIVVEDDAWICAGAKVIGGAGVLRVGRGTVLGANAVLRESTGAWEIWAGSPARRVGHREPTIWHGSNDVRPLREEADG